MFYPDLVNRSKRNLVKKKKKDCLNPCVYIHQKNYLCKCGFCPFPPPQSFSYKTLVFERQRITQKLSFEIDFF